MVGVSKAKRVSAIAGLSLAGLIGLFSPNSSYAKESVETTTNPNNPPIIETQKDPNPAQPTYENESESFKKARELMKKLEVFGRTQIKHVYDWKNKENIETKLKDFTFSNKDVKTNESGLILPKGTSMSYVPSDKINLGQYGAGAAINLMFMCPKNKQEKVLSITFTDNKTGDYISSTLVKKDDSYVFQTKLTHKNGKTEDLPESKVERELKEGEYYSIAMLRPFIATGREYLYKNQNSEEAQKDGIDMHVDKNPLAIKNKIDAFIKWPKDFDFRNYSFAMKSECDELVIPYLSLSTQNKEDQK